MTSVYAWSCMPFLYPCLTARSRFSRSGPAIVSHCRKSRSKASASRAFSSDSYRLSDTPQDLAARHVNVSEDENTRPSPDEYYSTSFADNCTISAFGGGGGNGCISFLREIFISDGPANGGDGGTGGSVFIQAVKGETSLHRVARTGIFRAGRGKNGQGRARGGERGKDVLIEVPVGTIVREVSRHDPFIEATDEYKRSKMFGADKNAEAGPDAPPDQTNKWRKGKWLLYPGLLPSALTRVEFPALPRPRKSNIAMAQPPAPLRLDLDKPMDRPILLAAGAVGGLGNTHFVTKNITKPKFATRGEDPMSIELHFELKILADVGLVGMPNAGKSTLLRAISNSRTRVGDWEFTTLQPNIGTVVVDDYRGRPKIVSSSGDDGPRTSFTVADIPGLIEGAHQDKGLGLGFLRHVERAAVLAFVVDLSAGDAVTGLKTLWNEITQYQFVRDKDVNMETERRNYLATQLAGADPHAQALRLPSGEPTDSGIVDTQDTGQPRSRLLDRQRGDKSDQKDILPPITSKPWLVIATKADLPETQANFQKLREYVAAVTSGAEPHPSGLPNAWRRDVATLPVSAINTEGTRHIPEMVVKLLDM